MADARAVSAVRPDTEAFVTPRLTSLTHGGGCGCKLPPSVLEKIISGSSAPLQPFASLLVGAETSDDAAVYLIDDERAVVATTDFFTPIVDDPFDFGRIAAANALSDVYAMGGKPLLALAIVGMPVKQLGLEAVGRILDGGASVCASAGIPVAGGHSIDVSEPIYGLAVVGIVGRNRILRNDCAQSGDCLILTKPLGIGVYSAALKQGLLQGAEYREMVATATQLNSIGAELQDHFPVSAATDVTGFGLLGHILEMCRGAKLTFRLRSADVPLLTEAQRFARAGVRTGAAKRNWASYSDSVKLSSSPEPWWTDLLCDPQTSGGLLIATAAGNIQEALKFLHRSGFEHARVIGRFEHGPPELQIEF